MKQAARTGVSLGAIASSLAALACCFPVGAAVAAGLAGASPFTEKLRPWMLGLSVLLLAAGFWQRRHARQCGLPRSRFSDALLWIATAVVAGMLLFPQELAGFIADHIAPGRLG